MAHGVALPRRQEDLGFSQENLSWVFNAYVVAFGGLLLLSGRLADLFGARRGVPRRGDHRVPLLALGLLQQHPDRRDRADRITRPDARWRCRRPWFHRHRWALIVTVGLGAAVYAIVRAPEVGWRSVQTWGLLLAAVVLLGIFLAIQNSRREPLMRLSIFRTPNLGAPTSPSCCSAQPGSRCGSSSGS